MKQSKKISFYLITFLLPFLILLFIETGLRISGLFQQEPLFLKVQKNGRSWYETNADIASRYFDAKEMAVPKLYPQRFSIKKPDNTIRIFCLGGSTTAGFPFEAQVPFPFQLKKILQAADPQHDYEVINLGLSAVNSFTVLDLIADVLHMEPDILVIYMGHNEFYGAYGSASTISIGSNGMLVRFFLQIQKWHIVQAIKSLVSAFSPGMTTPPKDETLMEKVIADKSIPCSSATYKNTLANFRDNLTEICALAREASIPVYIGSLVSNVRDMPPMEYLTLIDQKTLHHGNLDSVELAQKILQDSNNALLHYQMGQLILDHDNRAASATELYEAKDLDQLRFRASEDLNQIIYIACNGKNVFHVDVKHMIEKHSEFAIPGNDLFCDHLHPNPEGYRLMADCYAREIKKALHLNKFADSSNIIHITDLDWEMGLIKIYKLLQRWPFANKTVNYADYRAYGDSLTKDIAYKYVYAHHNWPQAHYDLAAMYLKQENPPEARKQYLAVSDFYPQRASPLHKIAETYIIEKKWPEAETYLQKALHKSEQKGQLYRDLSTVQWKQGKIRETLESIQHAIVAPEFNRKQKAQATYQLAEYLVSGRRYDNARKVLLDALYFDPDFMPAKQLLDRLPDSRN